jgi:hypothetical protein
MLSREAHFAPKGGLMASFRALQGSAVLLEALPAGVLSRVCSIFYMTIVKKMNKAKLGRNP